MQYFLARLLFTILYRLRTTTLSRFIRKEMTFFLLLGAASLPVSAATLFHDDFSDEAQSNLNWAAIVHDDRPMQFSDGHAALENSSATYAAFAMHALRSKPASISFSGRVLTDLPGTGLFYCTGKEAGVYAGYAVVIGEEELFLLEYGARGEKEVLKHVCRFLLPGGNTIAISGDSQFLRVFCNGYFQFSFPNSLGSAGDVAIIIPPSSAVSFDDISVEDTVADTMRFPPFLDPLTSPLLTGWLFAGNGNYEQTAEGLSVVTRSVQTWYGGIVVPVADFRMSAALRHQVDNGSGTCGFILITDAGGEDSFAPGLRFGITAAGRYVVEKRISTEGFSAINEGLIPAYQSGAWDTLTLSRQDSTCSFAINNTLLVRVGDSGAVHEGTGLFSAESLSVCFKDFTLLDCSDEPLLMKPAGNKPNVFSPFFSGGAYDLLGRVLYRSSERWMNHRSGVAKLTIFGSGRKFVGGMQKR